MIAAATEPVRLHFASEGEGPPVLLLHGFTGSSESMAGAADAIGSGWRRIRADLVGHGRSPAPRHVAAFRMEACVGQLVALLDALRLPSVHVLGYSMGGRAALALAVLHPDRVRSLLAVGARAGIADAQTRAARVAADEALADRIESDGVAPFVDEWMALPLFASQKRLGEQALARARAQRLRNDPRGLAQSLRGMGSGAQPDFHDALGELACPVALCFGDEDVRFAEIASELAARIPRAELLPIPEAGHAAHLENPAAFGARARHFFERAEARR